MIMWLLTLVYLQEEIEPSTSFSILRETPCRLHLKDLAAVTFSPPASLTDPALPCTSYLYLLSQLFPFGRFELYLPQSNVVYSQLITLSFFTLLHLSLSLSLSWIPRCILFQDEPTLSLTLRHNRVYNHRQAGLLTVQNVTGSPMLMENTKHIC